MTLLILSPTISSTSSLSPGKLHNLCFSVLVYTWELFDDSMKNKMYVLITMPGTYIEAATTCWLLLSFKLILLFKPLTLKLASTLESPGEFLKILMPVYHC